MKRLVRLSYRESSPSTSGLGSSTFRRYWMGPFEDEMWTDDFDWLGLTALFAAGLENQSLYKLHSYSALGGLWLASSVACWSSCGQETEPQIAPICHSICVWMTEHKISWDALVRIVCPVSRLAWQPLPSLHECACEWADEGGLAPCT